MDLFKSPAKTLILFIPLIGLLLGLVYVIILISDNQFPPLSSDKLVTATIFTSDAIYQPTLNSDKSMTFNFYPAKIEDVEMKNVLFKGYLLLTLRTYSGAGPATNTFQIQLPSNLQPNQDSSLKTNDLVKLKGQQIAMQITYSSQKNKYTFYDVKSWHAIRFQ